MAERAPWQAHFGFTRTPFGKSLAPSEQLTRRSTRDRGPDPPLHRRVGSRADHRRGRDRQDGRGPGGPGEPPSGHAVLYIANPAFGTRASLVSVVHALGGSPRFQRPSCKD